MAQYLSAVPFTHVTIEDRFWFPRQEINRTVTLPAEYRQCKETGRIDAFALNWEPGMEPVPHIFWDSDVAKWIEAVAYSLATHPDPAQEVQLDEVIALIASAQQPDGYINTHFTAVEPEKRWKDFTAHELYCAGHLIEAAVAHFQATGKRTLLDPLCRYADYIDTVFGTGPGQRRGYCGHEEIELALVKLARIMGEPRYLRLASFFVEERGRKPNYFELNWSQPEKFDRSRLIVYQAHKPVREQDEVVGHAVRAMYLYSAMADLAARCDDASLLRACERLWKHLCEHSIYLTGGIGSTRIGEGFSFDYDLPNETAYAETCAAIGLVFWAHRMLQLTRDGVYADIMERALYNGVISGVALSGDRFFYENPLASLGQHHRQGWFPTSCCPPNIARLLASLGQYVYSRGEREAVVHLYIQGSGRLEIDGANVTLRQATDYPWDGCVTIGIEIERPHDFALKLRVPGWCRGAGVSVNGEPCDAATERGYLKLRRTWQNGDTVQLTLPMPVERVHAHPRVRADAGRIALQRGPLVYCFEEVDNGGNLNALALASTELLKTVRLADLLGGIVVLEGTATRLTDSDWGGSLYRAEPALNEVVAVRAVPYCLWDNREAGEMLVWIRKG